MNSKHDESDKPKKWVKWLFWPLVVGLALWFGSPLLKQLPFIGSYLELITDHRVYYRFKASYLHGAEAVNFDVVVGCSVRVTGYKDGDRSYDAARDPILFVKATSDGGAILQWVTNACQGDTTENGGAPKDFLPGAIWFDKASDLTLGVAYYTENAFDSPKSKLKFLGAKIEKATRDDWLTFRPIAAQNLLDPRQFTSPSPLPPKEEIQANLWNKKKLTEWFQISFQCRGVERYHIIDPAIRAALRQYWPASHPKFWQPSNEDRDALDKYINRGTRVDGGTWSDYFRNGGGFPTRARGGTLASYVHSGLPSKFYPIRADDGMPWLTPELATADTIFRDVEFGNGGNVGFLYCYVSVRDLLPHWYELLVPGYFHRNFVTRVDGEIVHQDSPLGIPPDLPEKIFERDEYFYRSVVF